MIEMQSLCEIETLPHSYNPNDTYDTERTVQRTTVRKTLRTSPRAWACRRTRDAAVGQR